MCCCGGAEGSSPVNGCSLILAGGGGEGECDCLAGEPVSGRYTEPVFARNGTTGDSGAGIEGVVGAADPCGVRGLVRAPPCSRGTAQPGMKPVLPRAGAEGLAAVVESTGDCAGGTAPGGIKIDLFVPRVVSRAGTADSAGIGAEPRGCGICDAVSGMKIELFFPLPGT